MFQNSEWLAVIPYWAVWPFEILLCPKYDCPDFSTILDNSKLAEALQQIIRKYDLLFNISFPYSMGWHSMATQNFPQKESANFWQLHCHFHPPLLRSATVKKFMVGYEMFAESQRDLTPEQAADKLREL